MTVHCSDKTKQKTNMLVLLNTDELIMNFPFTRLDTVQLGSFSECFSSTLCSRQTKLNAGRGHKDFCEYRAVSWW